MGDSDDGHERQLGGNAHVRGLTLWLAAEPRGRVEQVEVAPLQASFGSVKLRADRARVEQARTPGAGQRATALVAERLVGEQVSVGGTSFLVRAGSLEAPEGVRIKRSGEILAPKLALGDFRLEFPDVMALGSKRDEIDGEGEARPPRDRLRWDILDELEGHLNVDLLVDLTGPIVGRREETHHFRVTIENGAVDYERLEGDVHWFERSFVDMAIGDERLELRRNIPLIPFSGKPLLYWPLDAEGLELARKKRIKLRDLLGWELPEEERARRAGGSRVKLNQIAAQNIDVALALAEPAWLELGAVGRIHLAAAAEHGPPRAALTGELEHVAGQDPRPNRLEAAVGPLQGAIEGLRLGSMRLSAARVWPERLRGELHWTGMRPTSLIIAAERLVGEDVRLEPVG